ncbi:MAG TPA: substrate-binding domain-containing protein [Dissulfurispiraceae bacterium]|nr:substrate-binding domain-containing protein [Dissulfurispiraceae bacterium]
MSRNELQVGRRTFLSSLGMTAAAALLPSIVDSALQVQPTLHVWSCGGLSEAFIPANALFTEKYGAAVAYTGAFAAALGKSLLGEAQTEIFAGRVLKLAKDLRSAGKMLYFKPLCFTEYVLVTPKGNPLKIASLQDLVRSDVRVYLPLGASPPGGDAVVAILKKAKLDKEVLPRLAHRESCVVRMMSEIVDGRGHVSIVERRLTRLAKFEDKVDVVDIPTEFYPPGPRTFTIGVMKHAKDRQLADSYVDFMCSDAGQSFFERRGFIPARSDKGKELVESLGVKDA